MELARNVLESVRMVMGVYRMKIQFKFMMILVVSIIIVSGVPTFTARAKEEGPQVSGEAPLFQACLEYSFEGYVVKGSLTELIPNLRQVQPMYSLDGQTWQPCGVKWNLHQLPVGNSYKLTDLQNQICLYDSMEPLKSYLAGRRDRFYLKLHATGGNGAVCETNIVIIERTTVQQVPEEITFAATFAPAMRVIEKNPFCSYGRYQMNVNADVTLQDISALLPDTIPVEVQIYKGKNFIAEGIVDCPVTWKALTHLQLAAGETVTIPDAAEELVIPAGTMLSTPIGVFSLEKPLRIAQDAIMKDEIRLVLNIFPIGERPPETPTSENSGGAGGNEVNAGADNKKDSTEEGQRPVLPWNPESETQTQQNPESKTGEQQPDLVNDSESRPEDRQSDSYHSIGNASEAPARSGVTFSNAFIYESQQSQQATASVYQFESSAQLLAAEAVADICTSVVIVRMRASNISRRMIPQIVCILNMVVYTN